MMLRIILFAFLTLAGMNSALAADRALVNLLGYSADGRYFAFEEYGVHDGSGAPYAAVTIIDLTADQKDRLAYFDEKGGEDDLLPPIRAKAMAKAAAKLKALKVTEPAQYVSMVGDGVAGADGFNLRFGAPGSGPIGEVFGDQLLKLEVLDTSDKTGCFEPDDNQAKGLALSVVTTDDQRQVFSDSVDAPPAWRLCPLDYRLYAVVLPYNGDITQAVALISLYTAGWEGMDRSFLAIPVGK